MDQGQGCLFVVATPIGNLEDLTLRALRVLREADCIAAEDTRHTRKLLSHYGISTPLVSYHEHNEQARANQLAADLAAGRRIALVTDAGTPCISDPGYRIVRLCRERGLPVVAVPGPCAAVTALSVSGWPGSAFAFHGFFPRKQSEAEALLAGLAESATHVFYESPNRIVTTLARIAKLHADAGVCLVRELTKVHEEAIQGTAGAIAERLAAAPVRGECVLILTIPQKAAAPPPGGAELRQAVDDLVAGEGLSRRDAIRRVAELHGVPRKTVYAAAVLDSDS